MWKGRISGILWQGVEEPDVCGTNIGRCDMSNIYLAAGIVTAGLIVAVTVGVIVIAMRAARQAGSNQSSGLAAEQGKYPEGSWLGKGISIGIVLGAGFGVAIGTAMDNLALGIALGPAMGLPIGVAIGSSWEQQHKDEIRPLTEDERRMRRITTFAGVAILAIGVLAFAAILLLRVQS
jgi:hypothetical protein